LRRSRIFGWKYRAVRAAIAQAPDGPRVPALKFILADQYDRRAREAAQQGRVDAAGAEEARNLFKEVLASADESLRDRAERASAAVLTRAELIAIASRAAKAASQ
jgi:hypothetical protein